jgi:hypothetical protein
MLVSRKFGNWMIYGKGKKINHFGKFSREKTMDENRV